MATTPLSWGGNPIEPLTAQMVREAVKKLKAADVKLIMHPYEGMYYQYWTANGELHMTDINPYHEPVLLENKDVDLQTTFKQIDEKIKKEWGK